MDGLTLKRYLAIGATSVYFAGSGVFDGYTGSGLLQQAKQPHNALPACAAIGVCLGIDDTVLGQVENPIDIARAAAIPALVTIGSYVGGYSLGHIIRSTFG